MNEAETRAELIDPKLKENGWDGKSNPEVKVHREYHITAGKIKATGGRNKPIIADYLLTYKGRKLAVVEAKSDVCEVGEGVAQAKDYAEKLQVADTYATNGKEIYHIDMDAAKEGLVADYHTPDASWNKAFPVQNDWQDKFDDVPDETKGGTMGGRFYQDIAVESALDAIAEKKNRILLTLATGTGKTFIAFQIAWKLFHTRWNLSSTGSDSGYVARRPRILFLADRNILADQAFNAFSAFPEDALVRIKPNEIRKKGRVPTNGSIFFTIFQTFMSGASTSSAAGDIHGVSLPEPVEGNVVFNEITEIEAAYGYTYILECADGSFYTGSTKNLHLRLEQHRMGEGANHTKKQLPVKLIYYETFDRIDEAFKREKQIQGWSRAKKIALINGDIELLKKLSKSKSGISTARLSSPKSSSVPGNATDSHSVAGDSVAEFAEAAEATSVPYFGEYPADYFDLIVIDECHRGGANDESNWRGILEYFSPAIQIGLTATPKRKENVDTYKYFGNPVYIYSLKDGINDGFLTPFKVRKITTSLDTYTYHADDNVVEGEIEEGKTYHESDFNRIIEIKAREEKRVKIFMDLIDQNEKSLVFCATQEHAAAIRDLINQYKKSKEPNYCVRVTANDGELGEQYLRDFQDNERSIPTILTTSQKLSTGVDARNIRNIILLRPVNNIVEFKQIVGRGTRLFDGKYFFTIYDFVNASERFKDPEWDGEPVEPEVKDPKPYDNDAPEPTGPNDEGDGDYNKPVKIKIRLGNGKEHQIEHSVATTFIGADGKPMTVQEFLNSLFGKLPELFNSEDELRKLWSDPSTRKGLLDKLSEAGLGKDEFQTLQKIIDAEKSDLFDVLEFIAYSAKPITREERVAIAQRQIFESLDSNQKDFIEFVLNKYIETGVEELEPEKLPHLLELKYYSVGDGAEKLGGVSRIRKLFIEFQKYLYEERIA